MSDQCRSCGVAWNDHPGVEPTCRELKAALHRIVELELACDMGLDVVNHLRRGRTEWPETFLKMVHDRIERTTKGIK